MGTRIEVDFNVVLTDMDGEPYTEADKKAPEGKRDITLGWMARTALTSTLPDDKGDGADIYKRCQLAERIINKPLDEEEEDEAPKFTVVELNKTQRTKISKRIFQWAKMPIPLQNGSTYQRPEGDIFIYRCDALLGIEHDDEEEGDE